MAPIDTFWTKGGVNLIDLTAGDGYAQPYTILPGSDGVDYSNAQVWVNAGLLFTDSMRDPATGRYPDRPSFVDVTPAQFMTWHSEHQVEYILEMGSSAVSSSSGSPLTVRYHTFVDGPTMVLGQDGRTIYDIERLTAADIATMPFLDQKALAGFDKFQEIASSLMIRPASGETADSVRIDMLTLVETLMLKVKPATYTSSQRDDFLKAFIYDPFVRVTYYQHFFVEQLELYKLRLQDMALFSEGRIKEFLSELEERYDRLKSYCDTPDENLVTSGLQTAVNAIDTGDTIKRGISIFLEMESQLFQIALSRAYVVVTGTLVEPVKGKLISTNSILEKAWTGSTYSDFGTMLATQAANIYARVTSGLSKQQVLDGPNLIFILQTFSNYEAEAEAQIRSEDLQQKSKLLEDYSKMQKLLNDTLNKYEVPESDEDDDEPPEPQKLGLKSVNTISELTTEEQRVAAMFDTTVSSDGGDNTYHPLEREKFPDSPETFRPTEEIAFGVTLVQHEKTVWDALSVKLGEATKILGQDSQLDMDAVNKLSQEKNRHYELGSNVLNKMTELLREITS